jgi:glycosyltransferase involved in cell wall biosynthesis
VRTDTFFRAAAQVLAALPDTTFAGVAMAGDTDVLRWVDSMGLGVRTRLLPAQDEAGMASLFRAAHVSVSPSTHDGTPNTMLEAMACGCVPVAGDLESIREWIVDGKNGRLVDPASPKDVARAVVAALTDDEWRAAAARRNVAIIAERADREHGLRRAEAFYREVTG